MILVYLTLLIECLDGVCWSPHDVIRDAYDYIRTIYDFDAQYDRNDTRTYQDDCTSSCSHLITIVNVHADERGNHN